MNKEVNEIVDNLETQAIEPPANDDVDNEPKVPKGAQKRIDELTRQKHDERRRADKLANELEELRAAQEQQSQKVTSTGAPDPGQYAAGRYDPDYLEALTDYKVEQRLAKAEQAQQAKAKTATIAELEAKTAQAYTDYTDAKTEFLDHPLAKVDAFIEIIRDSDNPPELIYFLGKNPDELEKLGDMSPAQATRYIGKLEARMTTEQPAATKKVTSAPKPIDPLGSGKSTATTKDPEKMTMEEYAAYRKSLKK